MHQINSYDVEIRSFYKLYVSKTYRALYYKKLMKKLVTQITFDMFTPIPPATNWFIICFIGLGVLVVILEIGEKIYYKYYDKE